MIQFTESERAWHREMRGLTMDEQGREGLVGLTMEETELYVTYARRRIAGQRDSDRTNRDRYLELRRKHETARIEIIANDRRQSAQRQ
jgi:hypothetical protein